MTEPIKPLNLLTGMRELLSDPKKWTKGAYARNCQGYGVPFKSEEAVCFCLQGAAMKIAGENLMSVFLLGTEYLAYGPDVSTVWRWQDQDTRTHADVLKFLDTRIQHHLSLQQSQQTR